MKLSELLREVECEGRYDGDLKVTSVTDDTAEIKDGTVFVCIKHRNFDGHGAAVRALQKGACAVVSEVFLGVKNEIIVKSTREIYGLLCAELYSHPERKLNLTAVTGTNGKTTVVNLIRQIFEFKGIKCASLGTVENVLGESKNKSTLTTPKPPELYKAFDKMIKNECEECIMEASSQALFQGRLDGICFENAIFTNITPEHLDYHKSFDEYLKSKLILFKNSKKAIINLDSAHSDEFIKASQRAATYSINSDAADYTAKNIKLREDSVAYEIVKKGKIFHIEYPDIGLFSVYNSMAAAVCALESGIDEETITLALKNAKPVEGRAEKLNLDTPFKIYIDYAHTEDSLTQILTALKIIKHNRLIVLFGCGGDRDKEKRPKMFEAATKYADIVIVTSDNPRTENPQEIIDDILKGRKKSKCRVIVEEDRRKAISKALKTALKDDIVLLAGKGHEKYQIIGKEKLPFDERKEAENFLAEFPIFKGDET